MPTSCTCEGVSSGISGPPTASRRVSEYFQKAIEADPNYALAYAGLADSYTLAGSYGYSILPPKEAMPKAEEAAQKALAIDDSLAEAHTSLAYLKFTYDWDWNSAEQEFERAIALNPGYDNAHHWYSHLLMARGRQSSRWRKPCVRSKSLRPIR